MFTWAGLANTTLGYLDNINENADELSSNLVALLLIGVPYLQAHKTFLLSKLHKLVVCVVLFDESEELDH